MVLPIIIPADRATMPARNPWTFRYVYACAGGTPLGAHTPCMRKKHLHGVIDCMVEVWISPATFLLTLVIRSNYSISIAPWRQIYAPNIAGIPNTDASVTWSLGTLFNGSSTGRSLRAAERAVPNCRQKRNVPSATSHPQ